MKKLIMKPWIGTCDVDFKIRTMFLYLITDECEYFIARVPENCDPRLHEDGSVIIFDIKGNLMVQFMPTYDSCGRI